MLHFVLKNQPSTILSNRDSDICVLQAFILLSLTNTHRRGPWFPENTPQDWSHVLSDSYF